MSPVPSSLFERYQAHLNVNTLSVDKSFEYQNWLRYFLDFCEKYRVAGPPSERLSRFIDKLKDKGRTEGKRQQAIHAITLYFEMQEGVTDQVPATGEGLQQDAVHKPISPGLPVPQCVAVPMPAPRLGGNRRACQYSEAGYQVTSASPEWDAVLEALAAEIKVRHYSRKTLKTYALWSRQFQRFLKNKPPQELTTADVKVYLTWLAVKCEVAASTQNQAFNALLFLYRHALKRDFGELRGVPRAKKSLYVPMVLSRPEIDAILSHLRHPYDLVVQLLFGCGLRLFECLQLKERFQLFSRGSRLRTTTD